MDEPLHLYALSYVAKICSEVVLIGFHAASLHIERIILIVLERSASYVV